MSEKLVVDTHVFNRSLTENGEYRSVYEAIVARCDRIIVNTQIVDEYLRLAPKAGIPGTLILAESFAELQRLGKLQKTSNRKVEVGSEQDRPFIGAAVEARVRYIISNDPDLRERPVLRLLGESKIDVLYPGEYLRLA